jgi:hypothetical protein
LEVREKVLVEGMGGESVVDIRLRDVGVKGGTNRMVTFRRDHGIEERLG